MFQTNGKMKIG